LKDAKKKSFSLSLLNNSERYNTPLLDDDMEATRVAMARGGKGDMTQPGAEFKAVKVLFL
jgi:hypothetical protein